MNVIDSIVSMFSPVNGLVRMQAREAIKAYETAKSNFKKVKGSGDTRAQFASRAMREQARYMEENYDIVDGVLSTLVNNVVGKDGINVEPMPLRKDGTIHDELAEELSNAWDEFSKKVDTTGEYSRAEAERMVCRTWLRDGEVFGEHIYGNVPGLKHPNGKVPFSIQILEPDFVPSDLVNEGKRVSQGISKNEWNQPVKYHVYKDHPGGFRVNFETREVDAANMMHLKVTKRLHQSRGISLLASSIRRLLGLQGYDEAELVAARIAASMAFYIRKGASEDYAESEDGRKRRKLKMAPGTIFDDLKPGEDVGTIESKRPSVMSIDFRTSMVRASCSATGANASTVNKDYEGSYSSQRQELVDSFVSYGVLSNTFINHWSRPTYERFVQMYLLKRRGNLPPDLDLESVTKAFYQPPTMPWIDPGKEAQGQRMLVGSGFGTESEVIRSRGRNPQQVKRQRLAEIDFNREYGLVYYTDAYHEYYGTRYAQRADSTTRAEHGDVSPAQSTD